MTTGIFYLIKPVASGSQDQRLVLENKLLGVFVTLAISLSQTNADIGILGNICMYR